MHFPCQLVGKQGESVTLEASNGGLFVTVIPSAVSIDDAVLDVFGLGIRFTNLTMAVAALRKKQDFKAAEWTAAFSWSGDELQLTFPYDHDPSRSYRLQLDRDRSVEFIAFFDRVLQGRYGANIDNQATTIRAIKSPGRNDRCPCNSGKKYKKCCGVRFRSVTGSEPELPIELAALEFADEEYLSAFVLTYRENPQCQFDPVFWYELGTACCAAQHLEDSEVTLRKAISLDPSSYSAMLNLAVTLGALGRETEGLELLNGVPDGYGRKSIILANILQELDRHEEAIEQYQLAIQEEPTFFLPYGRILNSLKAIGSPSYEYWLLRGCKSVPNSAWLAKYFCNFLLREARLLELADATWIEKLKSEAGRLDMIGQSADDPKLIIECQLLRQVALIHRDRNESQLAKAVALLNAAPTGWDVCDAGKLLASAATFFGDVTLVRESFSRICPKCVRSQTGMAGPLSTYLSGAYLSLGDFNQSVAFAQQTLKEFPDNITSLSQLWWGLDELGQSNEAVQSAEKIFELAPEYPGITYNLGYLCGGNGNYGKSQYYYSQCLEFEPDNWMAAENLAFVELLHQRYLEADRAWKTFADARNRANIVDLIDQVEMQADWTESILENDSIAKQIRQQNGEFIDSKTRKFQRLTESALATQTSPSYVHDLEQLNRSTQPFIGSYTRISKKGLDAAAILEALIGGHAAVVADAKFYLQLQQRKDSSPVYSSVDDKLPRWKKLSEAAQASLIEAERGYLSTTIIDHAPDVVGFAKSVEITLSETVFKEFKRKANVEFENSSEIRAIVGDKTDKVYRLAMFVTQGYSLELGSMKFILSLCTGRTSTKNHLLATLKNFIIADCDLEQLIGEPALTALETLARDYRNPAAHARAFSIADATKARELSYDLLSLLTEPSAGQLQAEEDNAKF